MRGAHHETNERNSQSRIIPAYAGSTNDKQNENYGLKDHPRVCGEHFARLDFINYHTGSSPRMRGALYHRCTRTWEDRIIPAYAGSTHILYTGGVLSGDHPRVCGEHRCILSWS